MKNILLGILGILISSMSLQCTTANLANNEQRLYIAPFKKDCVGVVKMKCLQVKENKNDDWQNFYNSISGFNYQEGIEYEIIVKKETIDNPPADASNLKYTLIKELSAIKK